MIPDAVRGHVARRAGERDHLVVYLSGAHAYGFPSPDSDYDVKCVHVAPTGDLVGLVPRDRVADEILVEDGVEIDYGSNEIGGVLRGVLQGNGNYLERLLGELVLAEDAAAMATLRPLVRAAISRRVFRHYAGFARSQLEAARAAAPPPAKKVLYVLRTTLTGAELLRTGAVVTDLGRLATPWGFAPAHELIAIKRAGERTELDEASWRRWRDELDRALDTLAAARRASPLPGDPPEEVIASLDAWLVELRRSRFA